MNSQLLSRELFQQAEKILPGGVNSPVRAFGAVGGHPPFIHKAKGAYLWDVDGRCYVDYVGSWGPAILGHADDDVVSAVTHAASSGLSFGAPTEAETLLAVKIRAAIPSMEKMRFVSSGTEACMSAIRIARGFTGRDKIVKFDGNYHGHSDSLLAKAGSGLATFGLPNTPGVTLANARDTLTLPYNDSHSLKKLFCEYGTDIAAIIVEPIAGNCGFIKACDEFLTELVTQCEKYGSLLIFDEVMTGFRVTYGGVQTLKSIKPDLTTLGKVVGGGLPLAVFGGKADIMDRLAPAGDIYQAGTLSGNPLATACGLATLKKLEKPGVYESLQQRTSDLIQGLRGLGHDLGIPVAAESEGGMFGMFFSENPIRNFEEAKKSRISLFPLFFRGMLEQEIYLAPSAFEAGFVSMAHTAADIEKTLAAAGSVLKTLKNQ